MKILVINGPNLNMLGKRDGNQYGVKTLSDIENMVREYSEDQSIEVDFYQSNIEGEIVDKIQKSMNDYNGIIINAGGYTHTSVAIRDSIEILNIPVIEVHLSNISSREEFRHTSLLSPVCNAVIMGVKEISYITAIDCLKHINKKNA